jgi:hypothetical protein
MHVFSLMKGFGKADVWRLRSSSLENKDGEITLRSVSEIEEYSFKENTQQAAKYLFSLPG